jgi:hypothetical protein
VGKKEPSNTAGENINVYNHYGRQYRGYSKTKTVKKLEVPCDPAMPLLGIYWKKHKSLTIKAPAHPYLLQYFSQ